MTEIEPKRRKPGSGRPKKPKWTLQKMMELRMGQREAIVWTEIEHAWALVRDKHGYKTAKVILHMFGINRLERLPVERYNQFLIICKDEYSK